MQDEAVIYVLHDFNRVIPDGGRVKKVIFITFQYFEHPWERFEQCTAKGLAQSSPPSIIQKAHVLHVCFMCQ